MPRSTRWNCSRRRSASRWPYVDKFRKEHEEKGHEVNHYDFQGGGLVICETCGEQMHVNY